MAVEPIVYRQAEVYKVCIAMALEMAILVCIVVDVEMAAQAGIVVGLEMAIV